MRALLKVTVLAIVLALAAHGPVLAAEQDESAKMEDIKQLLVLTGSGELGVQVMDRMISAYKAALPQIPAKFWDDFMSDVNAGEINDMIVPIYAKHLTHKEIKKLAAFYRTETGKKLISVMPQITTEAMVVGQKWGAELGRKMGERLKEEGYLKPRQQPQQQPQQPQQK